MVRLTVVSKSIFPWPPPPPPPVRPDDFHTRRALLVNQVQPIYSMWRYLPAGPLSVHWQEVGASPPYMAGG